MLIGYNMEFTEQTPINLPDDFIKMLKNDLGDIKCSEVISDMSQEPSISIRINRFKIPEGNESILEHLNISHRVGHCPNGYFLSKRPSFTLDPLFHCGAYYVQDASSMIVEKLSDFIPNDSKDLKCLDLCAAPGGKSTHLLSLLDRYENSLLICNEVINSRASILSENISKWGYPNVCITNNDPADFKTIQDYFNVVLVDAPCSGEGMFRKDEGAIAQWSLENVNLCAQRQRRIVADIWPSLRAGGLMAYSTCTLNRIENEENVEWICSELGGETLFTWRGYPGGKNAGEGLFFAIIRKRGELTNEIKRIGGKNESLPKSLSKVKINCDFICEGFSLYRKNDILKAYPQTLKNEMFAIESRLRVILSGVAAGEIIDSKKGEPVIIPHTDLVQNIAYKKGAIPQFEITPQEAIDFLKKLPISLKDAPKGYILLTFKNIPLGLVKNIGNRTNNLWPSSRRIRNF